TPACVTEPPDPPSSTLHVIPVLVALLTLAANDWLPPGANEAPDGERLTDTGFRVPPPPPLPPHPNKRTNPAVNKRPRRPTVSSECRETRDGNDARQLREGP